MSEAGVVHLRDARAPDGMRIYAIGDVHGRDDLLAAMHDRIDAEIADDRPADWRIIHLGDFCDRGPDTKAVFDRVIARSINRRILSIMGNHEAGMLDFLAEPLPHGLFVNHGGEATALSYGIEIDFETEAGRQEARDRLLATIPQAHLDFMAALPRSVTFGDYFFCHAGIRPGVPLQSQDPEDLIWIRKEFLASTQLYEKIIVHGHSPSSKPEVLPNRINVDTGAVKTGVLTAIVLEGTTKRVIDVMLR